MPRGVRNNPRQLDNDASKKRKAREATTKIDWDVVDKYLEYGCSGVQVAATIGIHEATLRLRCQAEKGVCFSEYRQQKLAKGEAWLLSQQHGLAGDKNAMMQIWLGKNKLGQRDTPKEEDAINVERKKDVADLLGYLKKMQEDSEKKD